MTGLPSFILPGQIWVIAGDSESGHSALLRSMETRDAASVSFRHHFRNLSHTTDFYYQQRFNSADSEDSPTVREHLNALAKPGFWTPQETIERFQLQSLVDERLIKLSNGETKRLLLASALISNPRVLLLDHPLTGLDVATRAGFNDLLREITDAGILVVIAAAPSEIPEAATHVAVLSEGKIIHLGERGSFNIYDLVQTRELNIDVQLLKNLLRDSVPEHFEKIVEMNNVTVRYDGKIILDGINWLVRQGERWSLTGPNGAGKSTLLSLVNGDNPQAYANDIVLFDRQRGSGESIWDVKKKTGFVSPEFYQYFPAGSSCLEVIESGFYDTIGLFRTADTGKSAISRQWMALMGIEKYFSTLFNRVPVAAQRLCLLARALVKNPVLLILDEPTQGLDDRQQLFFTALINHICNYSSTTLIYVSHYQQHIPAAVTLHLTLRHGRVENRV